MGYIFVNTTGYMNYFRLDKSNKNNSTMQHHLDKYKIDIDNYWVIKKTGNFRLLEKNEYEKFAGITCFNKNIYTKEHIEYFFDFLIENNLTFQFLTSAIPPKEVLNKIKIIK